MEPRDLRPREAPLAPPLGERSLVALGGGSGLAVLLRGLKHRVARRDALTAVVTMADDGGSSGRLRRDFGVLPPGDIRNCIAAVADDEDLLTRLFQYRFPAGEGLHGHSFGNLFLTALTGVTGDFYQAVLTAESVLSVRGRILPSTMTSVRLRAVGASGKVYEGESAIGESGEALRQVHLDPPGAQAFPPAVEALADADSILLGPGSLYTSILPNLLIPGIREAIERSPAPVVLVLNLMTQPGETDDMNAAAHVRAISEHSDVEVDCVLANETPPPARLLRRYAWEGSELIRHDRSELEELGVEVVATDLLAEGEYIRHDPRKLAEAVLAIDRRRGRGRDPGPDPRSLRGRRKRPLAL